MIVGGCEFVLVRLLGSANWVVRAKGQKSSRRLRGQPHGLMRLERKQRSKRQRRRCQAQCRMLLLLFLLFGLFIAFLPLSPSKGSGDACVNLVSLWRTTHFRPPLLDADEPKGETCAIRFLRFLCNGWNSFLFPFVSLASPFWPPLPFFPLLLLCDTWDTSHLVEHCGRNLSTQSSTGGHRPPFVPPPLIHM